MELYSANDTNQQIGALGQYLAEQCLKNKGYKIIDKNFRAKTGEIDLIAQDLKTLVFIEVKTRTNRLYGMPEEAITRKKQFSIIKTAKVYLLKNNLKDVPYRIDCVSCEFINGDMRNAQIRHLQNAVLDNN